MSMLIPCPHCGPRDHNEFRCTGEVLTRPRAKPGLRELSASLFERRNVAGVQREWWHHRHGCEQWFLVERDTRSNEVLRAFASGDDARGGPA